MMKRERISRANTQRQGSSAGKERAHEIRGVIRPSVSWLSAHVPSFRLCLFVCRSPPSNPSVQPHHADLHWQARAACAHSDRLLFLTLYVHLRVHLSAKEGGRGGECVSFPGLWRAWFLWQGCQISLPSTPDQRQHRVSGSAWWEPPASVTGALHDGEYVPPNSKLVAAEWRSHTTAPSREIVVFSLAKQQPAIKGVGATRLHFYFLCE